MSNRENARNFHKCNHCHFATKSPFFKEQHIKHHESGREPFECFANIEIQCLYCNNYSSEELIAINKHIEKCHSIKSEYSEVDAQTTNQRYLCRNCKFQTYSMLNWYKHTIDVCLRFENRNEREQIFEQLTDMCLEKSKIKWIKYEQHKYNRKLKRNFKKSKLGQFFKCEQCEYKTKGIGTIKAHIIRKHLEEDEIKWFKCAKCDYKSKINGDLTSHIMWNHLKENEIKWFKCDKCDYKSKVNSELKSHMIWKHLKENEIKWFKCEQCEYKSKKNGHLKRHVINKHLKKDKIKWFKCKKCNHKSKMKGNLKQHIICRHSKEDETK